MWQFLSRLNQINSRGKPAVSDHRPHRLRFDQLVEGIGDFSDLGKHDKALKFWLPEPAAEAIKDLCDRNGDSMSEALRQFFAQHIYGIYAFHLMNETRPRLFRDPPPPKFSIAKPPPGKKRIATYWVPELGDNVMPIKVWIPARMRSDLQALADHVGIKLSQYCREIVISRLLGHGTLPKRPEMIEAALLPSADQWCEDKPVPMRQVTQAACQSAADVEVRAEWVDE